MIETDIESIKNKLKDDTFDLQDCEKKLLKIEKKLIQLENKFNSNNLINDVSDNNNSDSDCDINIDDILRDLEKLNTDLTNINTTISIEKLIDNYIEFKTKLSQIKSKNEDFKLKIEYL